MFLCFHTLTNGEKSCPVNSTNHLGRVSRVLRRQSGVRHSGLVRFAPSRPEGSSGLAAQACSTVFRPIQTGPRRDFKAGVKAQNPSQADTDTLLLSPTPTIDSFRYGSNLGNQFTQKTGPLPPCPLPP